MNSGHRWSVIMPGTRVNPGSISTSRTDCSKWLTSVPNTTGQQDLEVVVVHAWPGESQIGNFAQ
jgi:hypothetical protein